VKPEFPDSKSPFTTFDCEKAGEAKQMATKVTAVMSKPVLSFIFHFLLDSNVNTILSCYKIKKAGPPK
jgi:hypothetical protein